MATTVAHGLIGVMTYCAMRPLAGRRELLPLSLKALFLAAVTANIPDLDMLISLLVFQDHKIIHGTASHSLAFALAMGILLWLLNRKIRTHPEISIIFSGIIFSHVLVDLLTGPRVGAHQSHGVVLFWPIAEARIVSPVTLFQGVVHKNLFPGALYTAIWEFVIYMPMTMAVLYYVRKSENTHVRNNSAEIDL